MFFIQIKTTQKTAKNNCIILYISIFSVFNIHVKHVFELKTCIIFTSVVATVLTHLNSE